VFLPAVFTWERLTEKNLIACLCGSSTGIHYRSKARGNGKEWRRRARGGILQGPQLGKIEGGGHLGLKIEFQN
jgi:hypothetical protein